MDAQDAPVVGHETLGHGENGDSVVLTRPDPRVTKAERTFLLDRLGNAPYRPGYLVDHDNETLVEFSDMDEARAWARDNGEQTLARINAGARIGAAVNKDGMWYVVDFVPDAVNLLLLLMSIELGTIDAPDMPLEELYNTLLTGTE